LRYLPLIIFVSPALVLITQIQAVAAPPNCKSTRSVETGEVTYVCDEQGQTKKPRARKAGQPSCELSGPGTYCVGSSACWIIPDPDPSVFQPPASPAPHPGADWAVRLCLTDSSLPSGGISSGSIWIQDTPASRQVAARQAVGNLHLPQVTAASAPPVQTLVNLDTWFAPNGPVQSPVRGTSALGVVAVATITGFTIDPADGTPAFTCPPTATLNRTAGCHHIYRRSSAEQTTKTPDGKAGYQVRAWTTWRIDFLYGGNPVTIPGAPTTINGPITTRILPVAEAQTLVVG
jgi:hypothetical protein